MAGLRTFKLHPSARTTGDATTIAPDARINPPFKEAPLTRGGFFSDPWVAYFSDLSERIEALTPAGGPVPTSSPVITHTGTSTTDGSGGFTASWPAFSSVFIGLSIAPFDPGYPGGIVAPTTLTLSSYTRALSTTDNLYPSPTMTPVAGATFNWFVSGY